MLFNKPLVALLQTYISLATALPFDEAVQEIPTPVLKRADAASTSGSLTGTLSATHRAGTGEYISPIQVGGQTFNVLLDTGSSDLWIKGPNADHLTATQSTSQPFEISYGSGKVSGTVHKGPVTVAGLALESLSFGIATDIESKGNKYDGYDGILGIASRPSQFGGAAQADSWIEALAPRLREPVVAFDFAASEVSVGYMNVPGAHGAVNYVSIDQSKPHWDVKVSAGGSEATCDLDTGTTYMQVPRSMVAEYWGQVEGAEEDGGFYSYPCDAKLPDMTFEIGGVGYAVPRSSFEIASGGDRCTGQPQVIDSGCIMGQGFLKNVFAVYDYGNKTVGLSGPK